MLRHIFTIWRSMLICDKTEHRSYRIKRTTICCDPSVNNSMANDFKLKFYL